MDLYCYFLYYAAYSLCRDQTLINLLQSAYAVQNLLRVCFLYYVIFNILLCSIDYYVFYSQKPGLSSQFTYK